MAYPVVLRVAAARQENVTGIESHLTRTAVPPPVNVDPARTKFNRILFGTRDIAKDAETMAAQYPAGNSKSAFRWAEMVLTVNADFFDKHAPDWKTTGELGEVGETWVNANLTWLKGKYPGLVNVTLHLDEEAPHLHVLLSPVSTYEIAYRRGCKDVTRINYHRMFMDDKAVLAEARRTNTTSTATKLGRLQTEYANAMAPLGLVRGRKNTTAPHITPAEHRKRINLELPIAKPEEFRELEPKHLGPIGKKAAQTWREKKQACDQELKKYVEILESKAREGEFMRQEIETLKKELRAKDEQNKKLLDGFTLAKMEIDKLRTVPLDQVAAHLRGTVGDIKLDDQDGKPRWKGAIDMLKDAAGLAYREAVVWLFYEFGAQRMIAECVAATKNTMEAQAEAMTETRPPHPKTILAHEWGQFKREINLADYAAGLGYTIDPKETCSHSIVMRREKDDDKIVIATNAANGHQIYFSARDDGDNGTIIDFIQKRKSFSFGQIRQELRPWIGKDGTPPPITAGVSKPLPTSRDQQTVIVEWQKLRVLKDYSYLESRGLTRSDLAKVRANDITKTDGRGNVLFGHYDDQRLCGWEVKNKGFTGFAPGGKKGLWVAGADEPQRIVVCESAIDALSYSKLFPDKAAAYLSFGGHWSDTQTELLRQFLGHYPMAEIVIAAVDNDEAGDKYVPAIEALAPGRVQRHSPDVRGQDWNDVLMEREGLRPPAVAPPTQTTPTPPIQATVQKKRHPAMAGPGR